VEVVVEGGEDREEGEGAGTRGVGCYKSNPISIMFPVSAFAASRLLHRPHCPFNYKI
jgi:hypothetical protein